MNHHIGGDETGIGDLSKQAKLLADTVREAGARALSMFRTELKSWVKDVSSPVSEADIAINEFIEQRLRIAEPDYGWLSEESTDAEARLAKSRVWVIDPIDGTRAFLAGRNDWSVSAALVEDGMPLIGAVFAPATDEFFFAVKNQGATLNGVTISADAGANFDTARMAGPAFLIERVFPSSQHLAGRKIGSLALRLCRVAQGAIDVAFVSGNSRDWDLAGADLIVHEAAGRMTTLTGESIVYNQADVRHGVLAAAGRGRHAALLEHLRLHPAY